MACSREKSLFLHREKDIWDHLAKEVWLHKGLAEQLAVVCQKVVELVPAAKELAGLRTR